MALGYFGLDYHFQSGNSRLVGLEESIVGHAIQAFCNHRIAAGARYFGCNRLLHLEESMVNHMIRAVVHSSCFAVEDQNYPFVGGSQAGIRSFLHDTHFFYFITLYACGGSLYKGSSLGSIPFLLYFQFPWVF